MDIGCGTGLSSEPMKKRGFYTVGLDASENMLKEGHKRFHDGIIADMGRPLPFRDNIFDCTISIAAIHYLTLSQGDESSE